ncbi:rhodanese-like domain-containing protein [Candidatus Saccharibacteria bacterium]|nr:rhodanese-like domain-containing protein [Candidatus Saccharibacteria bacterium]
MKKGVLIVIVAVALFSGLVWLNKSDSSGSNQAAKVASKPALTFTSVQKAVQNGAKFYDVRTPDEYKTGHFAAATNWSLQEMQANELPDVPKDTQLYVYCRSGNRSGQATAILEKAGFTKVTDLHGLSDVEKIGGKLITE